VKCKCAFPHFSSNLRGRRGGSVVRSNMSVNTDTEPHWPAAAGTPVPPARLHPGSIHQQLHLPGRTEAVQQRQQVHDRRPHMPKVHRQPVRVRAVHARDSGVWTSRAHEGAASGDVPQGTSQPARGHRADEAGYRFTCWARIVRAAHCHRGARIREPAAQHAPESVHAARSIDRQHTVEPLVHNIEKIARSGSR
jgi:hypothetical protein